MVLSKKEEKKMNDFETAFEKPLAFFCKNAMSCDQYHRMIDKHAHKQGVGSGCQT